MSKSELHVKIRTHGCGNPLLQAKFLQCSTYLMLPTNSGFSAYNQSYVSSSFSVVVRTRNLHCLVRIEKTLNVCNRTNTPSYS